MSTSPLFIITHNLFTSAHIHSIPYQFLSSHHISLPYLIFSAHFISWSFHIISPPFYSIPVQLTSSPIISELQSYLIHSNHFHLVSCPFRIISLHIRITSSPFISFPDHFAYILFNSISNHFISISYLFNSIPFLFLINSPLICSFHIHIIANHIYSYLIHFIYSKI